MLKMSKREPIFPENQRLIIGEKYRIDKEFRNSSIVTLVELTPQRMYATVKADDGYTWETMAYRLSDLDPNEK